MPIAAPNNTESRFSGIGAALLCVALIVLLDGPVWLVKLVPTQDAPAHLALADMIARFGWGGTLQEPAASFYHWNPRIEPNSTIYLLLAGLIRLTGDALTANTLFLSLYGLLWIASAFVVCRTETERPILPFLLLLPLAFGVAIHWGFYNYSLSVPLFLLFASFWHKVRERHSPASFVATAVFLAGLYLTHISALAAACLLLAADGLARAIRVLDHSGIRASGRQLLVDGVWAVAAALPVLVLAAGFLAAYREIPPGAVVPEGELVLNLRRLAAATYLFSFTWWEIVALAPVLVALTIAGVAALRRITSGDLMWPVFFVIVVLVSLLNLKEGVASLSERLAPYSWIAAVMTIAGRQGGPALVRALCLAALLGLIGQTAVRSVVYENWSATLESEIAAGRENPGQTFVNADLTPVKSSALFALRVRPTLHAAQLAAIAGHGVGLSTPMPSTKYFGYFPLQYIEARDFMRAMSDWETEPDDAPSMAKFRDSNHGAPQVLIVSSLGPDGSALARRLGYGDCRTSQGGGLELAVCKASTPTGMRSMK